MTNASGRGRPESLRELLPYLKRYRLVFVGGVLLSAVGAALDAFGLLLLIPFLRSLFDLGPVLPEGGRNSAERLIETLFGGFIGEAQGLEALRLVCLIVVGVILLKNVCLYTAGVLSIRVEEWFARDLRDAVHARVQRLPLSFFGQERTGQIISRVEADTREARLVPRAAALWVRHVASTAAHVTALLILSWRLTLIALVLIPIMVGVLRPILRRLRTSYRKVFDDRGDVTNALQETVTGIRLVKASGTEEREQRRFAERSSGFARATMKSRVMAQLASPLSEVLSSLVAIALVWVGAGVVLGEGGLGPEQFLAFVTLALRAVSPIKALSQVPPMFHQGLAAADRFLEILREAPEAEGGAAVATGFDEELRFEGVTFGYGQNDPVLHGIDLVIRRGETVALVGPSGGGKSTLVDLIPRFADPLSGRITLDGTDLRDFTLSSLRRQIGLVSQHTVIFHDTAAANIAYGAPEGTTPEAIRAAARAAHADEFIAEWPDGYDTMLGERGTRLSGGQRQRIGVARAVLREAPILVLDEATSALDSESEKVVQEAVTELFAGRTIVIIAHRLSTVLAADRIVVIEAGRIVDRGTHEDLLSRDGPFRRLFDRQLAASTPP